MGKDYGEPMRYDATFNGPIHNRSCTDILWLILFILFLGVWAFVGFYSMKNGDIDRLVAPMDSKGKRCGLDSGLEDKKYLVFFDIVKCLAPGSPITGCPTKQVCVNKCPDKTISFDLLDESSFLRLKSNMVCDYGINVTVDILTKGQAKQHIDDNKCAKYVIKSQPVLFRCIGDLSTIQCKESSKVQSQWTQTNDGSCVRHPKEAQKSLLNSATALDSYVGWIAASWVTYFTNNERETHILSAQIVQDLVQSRWYLLGALVAVVALCFMYIVMLRWVVVVVVWGSITGLLALLGFALFLCYKNYVYFRDNPVQMIQTTNMKGYMQMLFSKHQTWLAIVIIVAVVLCFLLLMVIFLRARITLAIALIKEGSKAVYAIKSTVFFPILPWILQCGVIAYGVVVFMYIVSIGDPAFKVVDLKNDTDCSCMLYKEDNVPCDLISFATTCHRTGTHLACEKASCHFTGLDSPTSAVWLHLVNLLGFFWMMFFVSGVADMMLASTFSTWYWTFKKKDLPFFTLTSGISRTFRYHLGTVALGSLIIAIVRVIRVILEYIDQKIKKFDNAFTRCIMCFCKCFCWCLENFLKFINKNAYIMCAVHGKSFCASARDAFSLLMRNIIRVVVLDKVTDFIFFLSKMLITIGVGIGVYYLLEWNLVYEVTHGERLHYNYVPAIILSIATYLVCTIFFNVYSMAVDTLFLCFLEDCERNDGSREKPYFMSKNLMKILGKKNKK